jgi:hypothetical protein
VVNPQAEYTQRTFGEFSGLKTKDGGFWSNLDQKVYLVLNQKEEGELRLFEFRLKELDQFLKKEYRTVEFESLHAFDKALSQAAQAFFEAYSHIGVDAQALSQVPVIGKYPAGGTPQNVWLLNVKLKEPRKDLKQKQVIYKNHPAVGGNLDYNNVWRGSWKPVKWGYAPTTFEEADLNSYLLSRGC